MEHDFFGVHAISYYENNLRIMDEVVRTIGGFWGTNSQKNNR